MAEFKMQGLLSENLDCIFLQYWQKGKQKEFICVKIEHYFCDYFFFKQSFLLVSCNFESHTTVKTAYFRVIKEAMTLYLNIRQQNF